MTQDRSQDVLTLREKLRLIRDSDHPASPWARNVVQCLDELKLDPLNQSLIRQLGKNVAMMARHLGGEKRFLPPNLTPDEIAAIFGLGKEG